MPMNRALPNWKRLRFCCSPALLALPMALSVAAAQVRADRSAAGEAASILPGSFAGWQRSGALQQSDQPQAADAVNAEVLKEYGFQQFLASNYAFGGNTLAIRLLRFSDASGAYGAFTFYRSPHSVAEPIGRGAAWDGSHVLFWTGATLAEATFGHITPMSPAELRELAADLPQPPGNANLAPLLPTYLPGGGLVSEETRYALGPDSYARAGGVLPPGLVEFSRSSAEAVTASYSDKDGQGQLTLLEYPTPQLAAARLRDIDAFLKAGNTPQAAWPQSLADSLPGSLKSRRSGPIVVLLTGTFSPSAAQNLINKVAYSAEVTWNRPDGYVGEGAKVAELLLGVFGLFAILGGTAVLLGVFFGGGRALIRRMRGKPASALDEETEFIRLNIGG